MQLVEPERKARIIRKVLEPPVLYAALIDSLLQNPADASPGFCRDRRGDDGGENRRHSVWPCAALLIVIGAMRAYDMHCYESRTARLSSDHAAASKSATRSARCSMRRAGIWCLVALFGSDDAVAHMICLALTTGYMAAARPNLRRPRIFQFQILLACGPMSLALALHGEPYYVGMAVLLSAVLPRAEAHHPRPAADFRRRAGRAASARRRWPASSTPR